ncbi:MAG: protein translocase subunit SecF [Terriglobia bacterium]
MELFQTLNVDWLKKKWLFIACSVLLSTAGMVSLLVKGGPQYGLDFRGGTVVQVKFREAPALDRIRAVLGAHGLGNSTLQRFGPEPNHEILIGLDLTAANEADLEAGQRTIVNALAMEFGGGENLNWNEAGAGTIAEHLLTAGIPSDQAQPLAERLVSFRDSPPRNGLIGSFEELRAVEGVTPQVLEAFQAGFSLPGFAVRSAEFVGPKVGAALRRQALSATMLGLASMLVYIAFRFEWIYGVASVLALLHDVVIALGLLSIANLELSLTVIAALLTLIGYSVNDKIVIFDRIRENVRLMRREDFTEIANRSINQTLSRTILTGGMVLVGTVAIFLFGGEVLRGFGFVLFVGILVGTYSSIGIASPLVASWQEYIRRDRRGGVAARAGREPAPAAKRKARVGAKA